MRYILLLACLTAFTGMAQVKKTEPFKPPVLHTWISDLKDSATIIPQHVEAVIGQPIRVTDDQNKKYKISSYQVLYRHRSLAEDEKTGKVNMTSTVIADRFKTTPLPALWVKNIIEKVKPGEEIRFFDVIVKDEQGRLLYAHDLVLIIR